MQKHAHLVTCCAIVSRASPPEDVPVYKFVNKETARQEEVTGEAEPNLSKEDGAVSQMYMNSTAYSYLTTNSVKR